MQENRTERASLFIYTDVEESFVIYYQLEIVIYIVTVFTNSLTILLLTGNTKLRILSNVFFATLAVSDLTQGIFGLIFNGMRMYGLETNSWDFANPISMAVLQLLWWFAINVSYSCLVLITLERWLFIAFPFFYQRKWNQKTVVIVLTAFLVFSFSGSFLAVDIDMVDSNTGVMFPIVHSLVCLIIIAGYGHIVIISCRQQNAIRSTEVAVVNREGTSESCSALKRNWKAVRMSLTIFALYFFTVSPWTYFQAFRAHIGASLDKSEVSQALNSWSCIHFCSNVFVYANQNKDFYAVLKSYLYKVLNCLRPKRTDILHQSVATVPVSAVSEAVQ